MVLVYRKVKTFSFSCQYLNGVWIWNFLLALVIHCFNNVIVKRHRVAVRGGSTENDAEP